jgi:hypothetical protein
MVDLENFHFLVSPFACDGVDRRRPVFRSPVIARGVWLGISNGHSRLIGQGRMRFAPAIRPHNPPGTAIVP